MILRIFLTLGILLSPTAWAQSLEDRISLPEWQELVRATLVRVPELQNLWDFVDVREKPIAITGGLVRNTMTWLHRELQTRTAREILASPAPSLATLQADSFYGNGTDTDLVGKAADLEMLAREVRQFHPSFGADHLDEANFNAFLKAGGATFDKILIYDTHFDDSLKGLEDFWKGRLVFRAPAEGTPPAYVLNNILRFLRFQKSVPTLRATEDSLVRIRQAAETLKGIPPIDPRYSSSIGKALQMVIHHWGYDAAVQEIGSLGLLTPLADAKVWVEPPPSGAPPKGLSGTERKALERMIQIGAGGRPCNVSLARRIFRAITFGWLPKVPNR